MSDTRYRAGSQRQHLWIAYSESGKEAAYKAARKLGINEKSATVYISEWEREGKRPKEQAPSRAKVFDIGDPKTFGTIINKGQEVSEVRFSDGSVRYVPNDKLLPEGFFNNDTRGCYNNATSFVVMENNRRVDETTSFNTAKRRCSGNLGRFIYAITGAGLVRMVPRSIWTTYPNIPA